MAGTQQVPTQSGNPNHYAAGSPKGGQFAPSTGASSSSSESLKKFKPSIATFNIYLDKILKEQGVSKSDYEDFLKDDIEDTLKEEYNNLVQQEKDDYIQNKSHKENYEYTVYNDVQDFIDNSIEKLFTENTVSELEDAFNKCNGADFYYRLNDGTEKKHKNTRAWTANLAAVILQKIRYPYCKMNPISEKEFIDRVGYLHNNPISTERESNDRVFSGKYQEIPLYRSMGVSADANEIHNKFFNEPKDYVDTSLGEIYNNYGSVIYMTTQYSYAKNWMEDMIVGGIVRPQDLKILNFEDNSASQMMQKFKQNRNSYVLNLRQKLSSCVKDPRNASAMADAIVNSILGDDGLFAIAMGYDAVFGHSGQLDILNPSVVDLIK